MKTKPSYITLVLLLSFLLAHCSESQSIQVEKKVLFIIVDGISADILEAVDTPNIDRIIAEGAYTRGWLGGKSGRYSQSPTVSAVGYNHVLTGVWSNKHNVYDNDIAAPNYNYWNIFRLFKHNHPDKPVAIYSSWIDNRIKLVGDGLQAAGNITIDIAFDGYDVDTLAFPHHPGYVQKIDELVSVKAAESITQDAPSLSWVYLWYPDDTGHYFGEDEEHAESIRIADQQVGRIWDAVTYRIQNHNEDWLVLIVTDHGRRLPDGRDHGGQSDRERTIWMVSNRSEMNEYFINGNPPITSIYPTISRFLDLEIPQELNRELDGVSLIGNISISDADGFFNPESNEIELTWEPWQRTGTARIYVSATNNFSFGETDTYEFIKEVPVADGKSTIALDEYNSNLYKIVIEAEHNTLNTWIKF